MSNIDREEVAKLLDDRIRPLENRVEKFLASQEERQRVQELILAKLTTVIAGDKEFGTVGLSGKVNAHEEFVNLSKQERSELKGMIRTTLFIGGGVITIMNLIICALGVYYASHSNAK